MTAKRLSRKSNVVTARYIGYKLKHSWTVMLICFITLFFCMVIPFLIQSDQLETLRLNYLLNGTKNFYSSTVSFFSSDTIVLMIIAGFFGIAIGCYSLSYMHNKVSAGFFHSLPEKRSGHFIASLITSIIDFVIPFVINVLLLTVLVAAKNLLYKFVAVLLLKMTFLVIFTYVSILAVSYVAGMLTGTTSIHAIFTIYLIFILPAVEFIFSGCIITEYLWIDAWDIVSENGFLLSPVFRFYDTYMMLSEECSTSCIISFVMELILIPSEFILAFVLYRKRNIEASGTPIIYSMLAEAVKYSMMFFTAVAGALFFDSIGDGIGWTVFGFISGTIIMFMIMNTVLNRTSKAMFKGVKGLGIFTAFAAFVFITAMTGFFGTLDYIVPAAEEIYVTIDGNEYHLTDEGKIDEFRNIMKEFNVALKNDRDSVIFDRNTSGSDKIEWVIDSETADYEVYDKIEWELAYSVRHENFRIDYIDKFGNTRSYQYYNVYVTELNDIIKCLYDSSVSNIQSKEEIGNVSVNISIPVLKDDIIALVESNDEIFDEELAFIAGNFNTYDEEYCTVYIQLNAILANFPKEKQDEVRERCFNIYKYVQGNVFNSENKQAIGSVYLYSYNNDNTSYKSFNLTAPIYSDDITTLKNLLCENEIFENIEVNVQIGSYQESFYESKLVYNLFDCYSDDYIRQISQAVDYILLYDSTTGKTQRIIDKTKIESLMNDAAQILSAGMLSPFTQTDNRYVMYVAEKDEYNEGFITYLLKK